MEQVQLPPLDGELDVLHVLEVPFQALAGGVQLREGGGHGLFEALQPGTLRLHSRDGLGRAGAGHHILALGIDEVLAVEEFLAGGGVAREGHARAAVVPHVAEYHALDADARAPFVRDPVQPPVGEGPRRVPAFEDGFDGAPKLIHGFLGENLAGLLQHDVLEGGDEALPVLGAEVRVLVFAEALLHPLQFGLEEGVFHAQHHVAVHGDEAAVGIPGEAGIAAGALEGHHRAVVQPEIENRIHHAWHGNSGAGAHREEQRILAGTEAADALTLQPFQGIKHFGLESLGELSPVSIIGAALLGREGEPRGHGDAESRHLGQVAALASQKVTHQGAPLVAVSPEGINTFDHQFLHAEVQVYPAWNVKTPADTGGLYAKTGHLLG